MSDGYKVHQYHSNMEPYLIQYHEASNEFFIPDISYPLTHKDIEYIYPDNKAAYNWAVWISSPLYKELSKYDL